MKQKAKAISLGNSGYLFYSIGNDSFIAARLGKIKLHIGLNWFFKIRRYFPYFMSIAYFDCDSARYYSAHGFYGFNYWHKNKIEHQLSRYSDGTYVVEIGFIDYLKATLREYSLKSKVQKT